VTAGTSFLEARLTVTDNEGATHTQSINLRPETVQLTFQTQPSGLQLVLDGIVYTTPVTVTSAKGLAFEVSAPFQGRHPCQAYAFETWSDGGAATHELTTPDNDRTFTATFAPQKAYCSFLPRVEGP